MGEERKSGQGREKEGKGWDYQCAYPLLKLSAPLILYDGELDNTSLCNVPLSATMTATKCNCLSGARCHQFATLH